MLTAHRIGQIGEGQEEGSPRRDLGPAPLLLFSFLSLLPLLRFLFHLPLLPHLAPASPPLLSPPPAPLFLPLLLLGSSSGSCSPLCFSSHSSYLTSSPSPFAPSFQPLISPHHLALPSPAPSRLPEGSSTEGKGLRTVGGVWGRGESHTVSSMEPVNL